MIPLWTLNWHFTGGGRKLDFINDLDHNWSSKCYWTILFYNIRSNRDDLSRIPARGGTTQTKLISGKIYMLWPVSPAESMVCNCADMKMPRKPKTPLNLHVLVVESLYNKWCLRQIAWSSVCIYGKPYCPHKSETDDTGCTFLGWWSS